MIRAIRSEWTRLKSPYYILGGIGLMAALGLIVTIIVFFTATGGSAMTPPGGQTVSVSILEAPDGMFAGLRLAANMWGIVALVVWAITASSDYSNGLIRLLVQAEPSRLKLLGGKAIALTVFTCIATLVTMVVVLIASPAIAGATGISADAWRNGLVHAIGSGYLHLTLAALMWGFAGLFVGVMTRSTGISIAVGIGYLLVFEMLFGMLLHEGAKWLPGSSFSTVAAGGTSSMSFGTGLLVAAGYVAVTLVIAGSTFHRRDITA
jgi:ABC-type transport system involved in multi-copper enzyme maturation permease subunit